MKRCTVEDVNNERDSRMGQDKRYPAFTRDWHRRQCLSFEVPALKSLGKLLIIPRT